MSDLEEANERSLLIPKEQNGKPHSTGEETSNNYSDNNDSTLGRRQRIINILCILITELCERLTFFGASANLVLFSKNILKLDSPWPSTISLLFLGACYLTPLLGGWLADTYLGRFNTIYGSSLLYFVGILLLTAVSISDDMLKTVFDKTAKLVYFALALVLIAFSAGGIKANVSPFGADQVQQDGPRAVQSLFNWFYWFISIGALIAFTVVVGVQQSDVFSGYVITAGTMFIVIVAFVTRRNKYIIKPPGGSQLSETAKIICEAIRNRRRNTVDWLDGAKTTCGGKFSDAQVEDVKPLLRVLPVFITFILFFAVFIQLNTSYLIQATFMRLKFESFTVPAASLSVFDTVIVIVLAPLMDRVIYPLLDRIGINLTPLRRIGVGFLFSAASVFVAGVVEIKRREIWQGGDICVQTVFEESHNASCLSIFWQIPQFLLVGASEVLALITGLEFAYCQAPENLKGVIVALFLVTNGIGCYVANLLVVLVTARGNHDWYPEKDPNKGHFEYFFFLLGGLMMLNFLVFLYVASSYKYKESSQINEDTMKGQDVHELTVSVTSVCS